MRKKLAVSAGLVAVVLVALALVDQWLTPAAPPLQVGMSKTEVEEILEKYGYDPELDVFVYSDKTPGPDWLGNERYVSVRYKDGRLRRWEVRRLPRTRPPWLDRALTAVRR
jgi:hypothetical protein